ncbi:MAG: LCP family protein [Chloroflexota bacterium]
MVGRQGVRQVRLAFALALVLAGSALAGPVEAAHFGRKDLRPWLGLANALVGPASVKYGTDGRLTVLVLGSDYRGPTSGERTDAVLIATINPATHQMAAVSIPRDTGSLPLPDPGDTYMGKVNSLYAHYRRLGETREQGLDHVRRTVAYVLDIEIDYVIYARFTGFDFLVDRVGYVPVDIPAAIHDSSIVDDKTRPHGALFPIATNYQLGGASATKCYAMTKPINWALVPACHRALLYVRSRHGKVGLENNSNYKRDKRQQSFLMAALARVVSLTTTDSTALTKLRDAALTRTDDFYTDLPITNDTDLLALYLLYKGAQNQPFLQATLKPKAYAAAVPGTTKWALKLDAVRALTHVWFAPVGP